MHVAFVSMRYPRIEGEFVRVYERKLVKYLRKLADISLLSWSLNYREKGYTIDGMQVQTIPVLDYDKIQELYDKRAGFAAVFLDLVNDILKVMGTVKGLYKLDRQKKIDVILAASFSMSAFYSILAAKLRRIPLVTQSFGFDVDVVPEIDYGLRVKRGRQRFYSDLALKHSALILPNSKGLAEDTVLAKYASKVKVVLHGVDTKEYKRVDVSRQSKGEKRKEKGLMVLNVGGLQKVKGWKYIVETAERLKKYNIKFTIIGRGDDLNEFNRMVSELELKNIRYVGPASHGSLKKYYQAADVFFLPSLSEGLPNSMLEASAMELALIGSGRGGTRDIIVEGKNGYYVKQPDAVRFSEQILALYKNRKLLSSMKIYARVNMERNFRWEDLAERLVQILRELVNTNTDMENK